MAGRSRRTSVVLSLLGSLLAGAVVGFIVGMMPFAKELIPPPQARSYPLPHHVPKYEGGVSLRFAMVHDVIHERFAHHGPAYYTERNRRARQATAEDKGKRGPAYFAWLDDLGAGLDYLGEHDEAARVLRTKLREQQALHYQGRDLYTTYANLGTFLIHGNFARARDGDEAAKERLREGLDYVHKSIEVNPQAHFGREIWQAEAVEYMLAALEEPTILSRFDLIGNRLSRKPGPDWRLSYDPWNWNTYWAGKLAKGQLAPDDRTFVRNLVARVGAEEGWKEAVETSHREPVPFDEPALGIIGMWRLGGGANPHFALALGEIMLRVGQRYIAWCAYERAVAMKDRFWPDPAVREQFVAHCRQRQAAIEEQLPARDRQQLRPAFEAELAHGRRYQQEYQQYEADRIAAGASIDDPHFYDEFQARHAAIASPLGGADQYVAASSLEALSFRVRLALASVLFFAGAFAFVTAWVVPR